jgi:putative MATE family efflux protein
MEVIVNIDIKNQNIIKISWPIFVSIFLGILLGYVDTIMLSNYNENSVGAIGNANTVMGFLTITFTIISSATGILTAQYLGAKIYHKLNQVYTVSILFNLVLSVIISGILFLFDKQLMWLLNVPSEMQTDTSTYIKIVGGLIFAQSIFTTFDQIFRNNGKTKIGMILSFIMNIINIVGDYSVLYGPLKVFNFGVAGVAAVTALSRVAMLIVAILYFIFKIDGNIGLKYIKPFPFDVLKRLLGLGVPTAGENISYNLSQIVITTIVNTLGIIAINTKIYCNMLSSVAYMFSTALGLGAQIIVGHCVGANEYDFAYKKVIKTAKGALIICEAVAILNFLISGFTLSVFSDNPEVISLGQNIMFIAMFLEIGRTINIVIIDCMKAAGDVKFPTGVGIVSQWGISVLFAFLLGIVLDLGLEGVWVAMALDEIVRALVFAIRWKKGSWRGKRVVSDTD